MALALAACGQVSTFSESRVSVNVAGQPVMLATPDGLCFDAKSTDVNQSGAFLLAADCSLTGTGVPDAAPVGAVMTASVSREPLPGSLETLEAFLTTQPGVGTLGKSGEPDKISVLESAIGNGVLYLKVRDEGRLPLPSDRPIFWRAFFETSDRLVGLSVIGFAGSDLSDKDAQSLLRAFVLETRAAAAL